MPPRTDAPRAGALPTVLATLTGTFDLGPELARAEISIAETPRRGAARKDS